MLEATFIKMVFKMLGANKIKFDTEKKRLIIMNEENQKAKAIPFEKIEQMFNERKNE
jgi:hypothetical protein